MLKSDIEIGETYLFVGSDSPKRKHLAGQPFKVVDKQRVFRNLPYRKGRRAGLTKVLRFFNQDGVAAPAEELEPLPAEGFWQCTYQDCREWSRIQDLHIVGNSSHSVCPHCGETAQILNAEKYAAETGGMVQISWDFNVMPFTNACETVLKDMPEIAEPAGVGEADGVVIAQDNRENPCDTCETGEFEQDGLTQPSGSTYYKCNECGRRVSFP